MRPACEEEIFGSREVLSRHSTPPSALLASGALVFACLVRPDAVSRAYLVEVDLPLFTHFWPHPSQADAMFRSIFGDDTIPNPSAFPKRAHSEERPFRRRAPHAAGFPCFSP